MRYFLTQILLIGAFLPVFVFGQKATAVLQTNKMKIGEHNTLNISLSYSDKEYKNIVWPPINEMLTNASLDIIELGNLDTIFNEKREFSGLQQKVVFSAFDSNNYWIPSLPFYSQNGDDTSFIAVTDSLMLAVTTVAVDTTKAFRDIKGPMDEPLRFSEILPYLIGGAVVLLLIVLGFYFYRKFKKKEPLFKIMQKPAIKPSDWALEQLAKIKIKKLWQQGFVKEYYVELTEVIRRYYQEEFGFNALEMTSSEIINEIKLIQIDRTIVENMQTIIENADLAKFAKSLPLDVENEKCMELSIEVIKLSQLFHDRIILQQNIEQINDSSGDLNRKGGSK